MDRRRHLETLSSKDPDLRRQNLAKVLEAEGLSYEIQEAPPSGKSPAGIRNFLLEPETEEGWYLFCAHYDAVPGTFGANDNGASLCILVDLARELKERGIPAGFAFFDGEETGNLGSRLYVSQMGAAGKRKKPRGAVNLDLCGFGDSLVVYGKGYEKKPPMNRFCHKALLQKHGGQIVKYLPKSDDSSFARSGVPAVSVAIVPRWDLEYLKALATYGEGFLGHPPEFDMIVDQMEVTTTIHGGYRDGPEWVEEKAMEQVYQFLLDGMTQVPPSEGRFGGVMGALGKILSISGK